MTRELLTTVLIATGVIALAGEIYVDCLAAPGGTGSQSAPHATLAAGVASAAAGDVVYVRGGLGRVYSISSSSDAVLFDDEGVSLVGCAYDWTPIAHYSQTNDMPVVEMSPTYAADCSAADGFVTDPVGVVTNDVTISGLMFVFGRSSFRQQGKGGTGLVCCHSMTNLTVEACAFVMTDPTVSYDGAGTLGVVFSEVVNNSTSVKGLNLLRCYFWLGKYRSSIGAFTPIGGVVNVIGNFFENMDTLYASRSGNHYSASLNFLSNIVLNCANEGGGYRQEFFYGALNYYPVNAEIAYNRFIHDDGSSLNYSLLSHGGGYGGSFTGDVRIHHNTVVGYDCLLTSRRRGTDATDLWEPQIFDNVVLLNDGGVVILELGSGLWHGGAACSYKAGSLFAHNGYYVGSGAFNSTAEQIAGYELTLPQTGNTAMDDAGLASVSSWFLDTGDPSSPDYYRPGSAAENWMRRGYAGVEGEYPAYLGALEPREWLGLMFILR